MYGKLQLAIRKDLKGKIEFCTSEEDNIKDGVKWKKDAAGFLVSVRISNQHFQINIQLHFSIQYGLCNKIYYHNQESIEIR